jgi:hypothetical protein
MNGGMMMLKAMLGIDPDELLAKFNEMLTQAKQQAEMIDNRVANIEKDIAYIKQAIDIISQTPVTVLIKHDETEDTLN